MSFTFDVHPRHASWLAKSFPRGSWEPVSRLLRMGPDGFEAYARVLALPDPEFEGQSENDVDDDAALAEGVADVGIVGASLEVMSESAGERLFFLLWEGWPYRPGLSDRRLVQVAGIRQYVLAQGTLAGWRSWMGPTQDRDYPPGFVWPADRSWCIAYDTDSHFAGVGGSSEAIGRLLDDPRMTVVSEGTTGLPPAYE